MLVYQHSCQSLPFGVALAPQHSKLTLYKFHFVFPPFPLQKSYTDPPVVFYKDDFSLSSLHQAENPLNLSTILSQRRDDSASGSGSDSGIWKKITFSVQNFSVIFFIVVIPDPELFPGIWSEIIFFGYGYRQNERKKQKLNFTFFKKCFERIPVFLCFSTF